MSRKVATCGIGDTLNAAAQIMWEHDCGFVPVLDGERLVGVVTDRDSLMAAYTRGVPLTAIRVREIMSREVLTCAPNDDVIEAGRRMAAHQIRRLPVVEKGRVMGVVSLNDVALAARQHERGAPSASDVGETLGAISQHRAPIATAAE